MRLVFKGGNELVIYEIDRENKILKIISSQTNYNLAKAAWKGLFDKGKEAEQEAITDKLNDEEFRLTITAAMAQQGYVIKNG